MANQQQGGQQGTMYFNDQGMPLAFITQQGNSWVTHWLGIERTESYSSQDEAQQKLQQSGNISHQQKVSPQQFAGAGSR